jgi:sigma-B regulation protein RsbU (phosphoserine phosphatase)
MLMPTLALDPNILELYVGTASGILYNYTQMIFENPEYDPRERPWYTAAVKDKGNVIFTQFYEDGFGTGMVLTAAKAVVGRDGKLIGVAAIDIQLDALKQLVLSTQVANTGYVFILDKYGTYIIHPDLGTNEFKHFKDYDNVPFAEGLRRMMNGERGFIKEETDDGVMYLAFSPLAAADWSVGVILPESEILSAKETLGIHMAEIADKASADMSAMSASIIWKFLGISTISICIFLIIGMYIAHVISRPILELSKGVALFGDGAFENRVDVKTQDEIGELASVFNKMADNIVKNMKDIEKAAAEQERINGELRIAAQIQSDMLPDVITKYKNHPGINIFASVEPALEMGGDLYDIFFVDNDKRKLCEVVADVSGKGISSAMFMVMTKTLIRNYMFSGYNPAETLAKANNRLCEDNPSNMFVTVFISITDLDSGERQYAQAGHNPVAYCPKGGEYNFIEVEKTMPLGFFPDNEYPLYRAKVMTGDKFFYYTDGVTEALDAKDKEWGADSLIAALNENCQYSCLETAENVKRGISEHRGDALQSDDITILVTEFKNVGRGAE